MQKKTESKKILSLILCIVLIAAIALFTTGCQDTKTPSDEPSTAESVSTNEEASVSAVTVLGEGNTTFNLCVSDFSGNETYFEIHTDKTTVGDALLELELIAGEKSTYGLFIKTVNGITADYDKDGKYWAFYINGEYATQGIDLTEVTDGAIYSLRVE